MTCKPLKSVNFTSFNTTDEVLDALDTELLALAGIANTADFKDAGHASQFFRNVMFIKGYFERYERILRDTP